MAQATDDSALATRWKTRIKEALSYWDKDFKRVERMRALAGGKDVDNPSDKTRRVNLIHSTIKGLLPHVYARLPEIAIQPKESMDKSEYEMLRSFATTLEVVLNELLEAAKLKRIAKSATRRVFSEGIAWAKVGWQRDIKQDPIILNRIADTQDNILQLQRLITELQGQDTSTHEAKLEELHQLQKSLEDAVEIVVSDGLVIDLLTAENVILDPAIASLEDWDKSRYIIHEVLLPLDTAKAQYPDASFSATATNDEARLVTLAAPTSLQNNERTRANERMVKIWEVWDKTTMTVYTLSDEVVDYVREPYQPEIVSEDWYPFYPLAFEITDSRVYPFSVTELLEPLQDEYLETREKYALHRRRAVPMMGVRKDALLPDDANRINPKGIIENITIPNLISNSTIKQSNGIMLSELCQYRNFNIGTNELNIFTGADYWLNANNLSDSVIGGSLVNIRGFIKPWLLSENKPFEYENCPTLFIKNRPKNGIKGCYESGNIHLINIPFLDKASIDCAVASWRN